VIHPLAKHGIATSAGMVEALAGLERALVADGGVVIQGETGTGGEVFARAIHLATHDARGSLLVDLLARAMRTATPNGRPFVAFDCAVANAVERRLFGSDAERPGPDALEQIGESSALYEALGGTLVLLNLPELPSRLQTRLTRILRDGEVLVAVAGRQRVDIRPIAVIDSDEDEALNPDLRKQLSQTTISVPPLRERREDLPALIRCLLDDICAGLNLPAKRASRQAVALLSALPWPGNLHELEGLLRVLVLKARDRIIRQDDVLANIRLQGGAAALMYGGSLKQARARFEREYVASVLAQHHGRMTEAAKTLGIQRTNLYLKVRQLAVPRRPAGERSRIS
jgi:DNA-binding NtrC family response regulator